LAPFGFLAGGVAQTDYNDHVGTKLVSEIGPSYFLLFFSSYQPRLALRYLVILSITRFNATKRVEIINRFINLAPSRSGRNSETAIAVVAEVNSELHVTRLNITSIFRHL
jgi:hypothetical protein